MKKKLNFCWCEIQCSEALDFITIDPYKIKWLGFQNCGNPKIENNKTEWIKTPSSFENIIDAISKCTLKYILEKLNIFQNPTLEKDKLLMEFYKRKLYDVKIVEEVDYPADCN